MMHQSRRWGISPVESPEELAQKLTASTWTLCQGFSLAGYLFLNDSTGPDGAQEFAIVKPTNGSFLQVESITFSWTTEAKALRLIKEALAGRLTPRFLLMR